MLLGFYIEFLRGHMTESSGALILACLVLVYIDEFIFGMRHSFQCIMVNVLSKSVVSLSYTRPNTSVIVFLVCSSVLYLQKSFRTSLISVSNLLIFCVCMLFSCFSLPAKKLENTLQKYQVTAPPCKNGEGIFP